MNSSILPVTIPARRGKATHLAKGQAVKVINIYGHQVVDTWAFNAANLKGQPQGIYVDGTYPHQH